MTEDNVTAQDATTTKNTSGEGAPVKISAKSIERRLNYIAKETRRGIFERKRNQVAVEVLRYIASGEAKSARNIARAFVDAYPEAPAEKAETTENAEA